MDNCHTNGFSTSTNSLPADIPPNNILDYNILEQLPIYKPFLSQPRPKLFFLLVTMSPSQLPLIQEARLL